MIFSASFMFSGVNSNLIYTSVVSIPETLLISVQGAYVWVVVVCIPVLQIVSHEDRFAVI